MKQRYIIGEGHAGASGARSDHFGADDECVHFQRHDALQEKLPRDRGSSWVALGCQHCHRNMASLTLSHPRGSCCVESRSMS